MYVEDVIQAVTELCRKYSAIEAFLFGSRSKGTARECSDIDIAVSGINDFELFTEEIESLPTLYTVDIVDMDTCSNQLLMEDIRDYGQKIYEKI